MSSQGIGIYFVDEDDTYYKAPKGQNCPSGKVTDNESSCANAGSIMGYTFFGSISSNDRPAGCFWDQDKNSYFNKVVDLSSTNLRDIDSTGGICKRKGINSFWA